MDAVSDNDVVWESSTDTWVGEKQPRQIATGQRFYSRVHSATGRIGSPVHSASGWLSILVHSATEKLGDPVHSAIG